MRVDAEQGREPGKDAPSGREGPEPEESSGPGQCPSQPAEADLWAWGLMGVCLWLGAVLNFLIFIRPRVLLVKCIYVHYK